MKKRLMSCVLVGVVLTSGCAKVDFSYSNPVTGGTDPEEKEEVVESDEDATDDSDEDVSDTTIDGYELEIAGDIYDLRSEGKAVFAEMTMNDMIVVDSVYAKIYDVNGGFSDLKLYGSDKDDDYYPNRLPKKFFDEDGNLQRKYKGKLIAATIQADDNTPVDVYRIFLDNIDRYDNKPTEYRTPDGYTERSGVDDIDDSKWISMDGWEHIEYTDTLYGSIYIDGEQVNISEYEDTFEQTKKDNNIEDVSAYLDEVVSDRGLESYSKYLYREYQDMDEKENTNRVIFNMALCDAFEKMDKGETENIVIYTFGWNTEEASTATLYVTVYNAG